jgi:hypothetical protein
MVDQVYPNQTRQFQHQQKLNPTNSLVESHKSMACTYLPWLFE